MSKFKPGDMVIANQDFESAMLERGIEHIVQIRKSTFGRVEKGWKCSNCGEMHFTVLFVVDGQLQFAAPRQNMINHICYPN